MTRSLSLETLAALQKADRRFNKEIRKSDQRALRIKERGERTALELARDIQTYKDEKANELRSQIERERGNYITREEFAAQVKSLADQLGLLNNFMASQQGSKTNALDTRTLMLGLGALFVTIVGAVVALVVGLH